MSSALQGQVAEDGVLEEVAQGGDDGGNSYDQEKSSDPHPRRWPLKTWTKNVIFSKLQSFPLSDCINLFMTSLSLHFSPIPFNI